MSSHCCDPTQETQFHLWDDMNNINVSRYRYYAMVRYVQRKVVTFTAYFAMRKTFRQNIILKDI